MTADGKTLSVSKRQGKTSAMCRNDLTRGIIQDHSSNASKATAATTKNAMIMGESHE